MTETETYYRLHSADLEFSPENAWSALWGADRVTDGDASVLVCSDCDGEGEWLGEQCEQCDGEGQVDADRGYSCCSSPEALLAYFGQRSASDEPVVVFEGTRVGTGFDGEPLVVPTRVVRWTTLAALRG